jgi:hypothetical protein
MTVSLPDRLSFAIDSSNGIKVSIFYHIPNLAFMLLSLSHEWQQCAESTSSRDLHE